MYIFLEIPQLASFRSWDLRCVILRNLECSCHWETALQYGMSVAGSIDRYRVRYLR